jgi:hypothetical protein
MAMTQNFKTTTDLFFNNIYEECLHLLSQNPSKKEWLYWANKFREAATTEIDRQEFLLKKAVEFEAEGLKE